jgi:DNA-binding NtrC family response regulator
MTLFDTRPTTQHPQRILVVEDEAVVRNELLAMLRSMGHEAEGARSYQSALALLGHFRPTLVLVDIYLGETKTGFDLSRQLRLLGIPFLFVTAHTDTFTVEQAVQLEPLGYVVKPFTEQRVFVKLELAIEKLLHPSGLATTTVGLGELFVSSTLEEVESLHIRTVLARTRGRIRGRGGAAELLGLHPNTLQSRLDKLGIDKTLYE